MRIRLLDQADLSELSSFLFDHCDSSMFLRSNLHRAGIEYRAQQFQAQYVGALEGGRLIAVVAHGWSGNLLLQAPMYIEDLVRHAVRLTTRPVAGLIGPYEQVVSARVALGMQGTATRLDEREALMALDLSRLTVPEALKSGKVIARNAAAQDMDLLKTWRLAYDIEAMGAQDTSRARQIAADVVAGAMADGWLWIAEQDGIPVSMSAFNAALPDIAQIGGVYTPPERRNTGFARAVIAGSLLSVRKAGVSRAILFTANPGAARCYMSLGFEQMGEFGLTLFA